MKILEGRKSNVLKVLSQLYTYLKTHEDLEKTEDRFQQRLEDAGCSDVYAVIDDVFDLTKNKKEDKEKTFGKIYRVYFKYTTEEEDEESSLDDKNNSSENEESEDTTLGDIRKSEEEYLNNYEGREIEDEDEEDEDTLIEESIRLAKAKAQRLQENLELLKKKVIGSKN